MMRTSVIAQARTLLPRLLDAVEEMGELIKYIADDECVAQQIWGGLVCELRENPAETDPCSVCRARRIVEAMEGE